MNRKVLDTVGEYRMLEPGDAVFVGVSGGADSVALLHLLMEMRGEWGLALTALHLNHNLRGAESDRDEEFVREFCGKWDIPLVVASVMVGELAKDKGLSVEQCAREARYEFFVRQAGEQGKIATAHTLSDSAETVLLNLARGTGLRGLCGIPPVRDNIVRPLIRCTRRDIEDYCKGNGLRYVTDSTNMEETYTRNKIRHRILPAMEEINPAFLETLRDTADHLRADAAFLDGMVLEILPTLRKGEGFCRKRYLELAEPLAYRVLLELLRRQGVEPDRRKLARMDGYIRGGQGAVQLDGNWILRCGEECFRFGRPPGEPEPVEPCVIDLENLPPDGINVWISGKNLRVLGIENEIFKKTANLQEKGLKNLLDCGRIGRIVTLRGRNPGDCVRLAGRSHTKPLKKLFQEAGIPREGRSGVLVLEGLEGVAWVEGFGPADWAAVKGTAGRVLVIEFLEDTGCTGISKKS